MKIITFLTDFGNKNSYVAQMKGVALQITDAKLIDISHEISPQNIKEAAFVLKTAVRSFPVGTVHVAVVDPGVGTNRRGIVITTASQILVGPDNGLLIPAAKSLGNFTVYQITNKKVMLSAISNTFHGRDIFTPFAAHILEGLEFVEIGPIINDYVTLDYGAHEVKFKEATGNVAYIDSFGNIITNIQGDKIQKVLGYDERLKLVIGRRKIEMDFVRSYNFKKKGEVLATIGSSNLLEISVNQGSAAEKFKLKIDDKIKLEFNEGIK